MKKLPLVTVGALNYNNSQYVIQCLESIKNQTYSNIELIIIDDSSSDRSIEIIETWLKDYRRPYRFIVHDKNRGVSPTCNEVLHIATGEYISFIATDDYWDPIKIGEQVEFLEAEASYAMCCSKATVVDSENNVIGQLAEGLTEEALTFESILQGNNIPALTVMIRGQVIEEIGGFDESLKIEDWDLWLRISERHKIGFLNKYLAFYRRHSTNVSNNILLMFDHMFLTISKWSDHAVFDQVKRKLLFERVHFLSTTNRLKALKELLKMSRYVNTMQFWLAAKTIVFVRDNS